MIQSLFRYMEHIYIYIQFGMGEKTSEVRSVYMQTQQVNLGSRDIVAPHGDAPATETHPSPPPRQPASLGSGDTIVPTVEEQRVHPQGLPGLTHTSEAK